MRAMVLTAALLAMPAMVQAQVGGAVCRMMAGCICFDAGDTGLLPILRDELNAVPGPQTLVMDRSTNTTYRTARSLAEVHRAYGGQGDCPADPERAELIPRDGQWRWRTLGETTDGCPAMLAGMLASSRVEAMTTRVVWGGSFDPQRLADSLPSPAMGDMSPYRWRQLGPGRWMADNLQERVCEGGSCVDISLALTMTLVAEDRITGLLSLRSRVEGTPAAILASFGMADCRVRLRYAIDHIGP